MRAPRRSFVLVCVLAALLWTADAAQAQTVNFSPLAGPVEGGTILRMSFGGAGGGDLLRGPTTSVAVDGVPVPFERAPEFLKVVMPPHAAGLVAVTVTGATAAGVPVMATRNFEYREWPTSGLTTPIERVSLSSSGLELSGYGPNSCGALDGGTSSDGRFVVFSGDATDAGFALPTGSVPLGTCGPGLSGPGPIPQIFLRDRLAGTLELISRVPGGGPGGERRSLQPGVSASGEWVGFLSDARNLLDGTVVADALSVQTKAFLHHRPTGLIERIDVDTDGTPGNHNASGPLAISADGSVVAFLSGASNLAPGGFAADGVNTRDVFVRQRTTGVTERWTVNANVARVSMSDDGRFLVFVTTQALDPADTNAFADVYLVDRHADVPTPNLVTIGASAASSLALISADGRTIAFTSNAANLVAGDTNGVADVFALDRVSGVIQRVSVASGGGELSAGSTLLSISGNGQRLAFSSAAPQLFAAAEPVLSQPWVHDRVSGETSLVAAAASGLWATQAGGATLTVDGRAVLLSTLSDNLVAHDTNLHNDVFVKQLPPDTPVGANVTVSPFDIASSTSPVTVTFAGVATAGETTVEVTSSGPALPAGFAIGSPARYFDITTTAAYAGTIVVCIDYTGIDIGDEATAEMLHHDGTAWSVVTTSRDVDARVICGETTSLSPFVLAQPEPVVGGYEVQQVIIGPAEHKAGSAVPVRIRVFSGGQNVSGAAVPVTATGLRRVGQSAWGPVSAPGNSNPGMQFDVTSVQGAPGYQVVVKTSGLAAGIWELRLQVGDSPELFVATIVLR